jgi:hypothetical protein
MMTPLPRQPRIVVRVLAIGEFQETASKISVAASSAKDFPTPILFRSASAHRLKSIFSVHCDIPVTRTKSLCIQANIAVLGSEVSSSTAPLWSPR